MGDMWVGECVHVCVVCLHLHFLYVFHVCNGMEGVQIRSLLILSIYECSQLIYLSHLCGVNMSSLSNKADHHLAKAFVHVFSKSN